MAEISVWVVDDEQIIRNGLAKAIDRLDEGFRVTATADDGETALHMLESGSNRPDLIITDIFMKYVDGIEFIEKAQELYPDIKFAILSGHGEFHLAQKAIRLKVCRYITKPVDVPTLKAVLSEIKTEILKERAKKLERSKMQHMHATASSFIRDKLLFDLVEGRLLSTNELKEYEVCFPFSIEEDCIGGIVRVLKGGFEQRELLLSTLAVKHLFTEAYWDRTSAIVLLKDPQTLLFAARMSDEGPVKEFAQSFPLLARSVLGIEVVLALGKPVAGLIQLQRSLQQAYEDLEAQLSMNFSYPIEQERMIRMSLGMGKAAETRQAFKDFLHKLSEANPAPESVIRGLHKLIVSLESLLREMNIVPPPIPNLYGSTVLTVVQRVERWIDDLLQARESAVKPKPRNPLVEAAKLYMQEHYGDCSLSLKRVADAVGTHPNYLTQIFRKQEGLSCMQYLAKLRMEKAKELLNHTNLKISEIAERVGYENPLYFSSYFKKWVGISPSDFKVGRFGCLPACSGMQPIGTERSAAESFSS